MAISGDHVNTDDVMEDAPTAVDMDGASVRRLLHGTDIDSASVTVVGLSQGF